MRGRSRYTRNSSVFLGGIVALAALLWICQCWIPGTVHGRSLLLLCHSLGFIALSFFWSELLFDGPKVVRNTVFAMIFAVLASTVVGFLVWGRHFDSIGVSQIALWQGLQGLPLLCLVIGRRLALRSNTMGLEIIAGGVLFLMAPILLEGFVAGARGPETARLMLNSGLGVSAWSTASQEFLGLDLFKIESMYREYRIGEKIYVVPMLRESWPSIFALSGFIVAVAGVLRGGRCLWQRIWTALT